MTTTIKRNNSVSELNPKHPSSHVSSYVVTSNFNNTSALHSLFVLREKSVTCRAHAHTAPPATSEEEPVEANICLAPRPERWSFDVGDLACVRAHAMRHIARQSVACDVELGRALYFHR